MATIRFKIDLPYYLKKIDKYFKYYKCKHYDYYNKYNSKMKITEAIDFILEIENLNSKIDLKVWCGNKKGDKIYLYVQRMAPEHWKQIKDPKAYVRGYYQTKLSGFKIYKCK